MNHLRIEPEVVLGRLEQLADDHRALRARIVRDRLARHRQRLRHDLNTVLLVKVGRRQAVKRLRRAEQCGAATSDDTLLNSCARRVERVRYAIFLLVHLGLRRAADLDDSDAAGELGEALLRPRRRESFLSISVYGALVSLLIRAVSRYT